MRSLAKSIAAAACLAAALLLATPGTASAIVQDGAATLVAEGNNLRADFTGVNTSTGDTAECWIRQMTPFFEDGPTQMVNFVGATTVNWTRPNGTFTFEAVCSNPGGVAGNVRTLAGTTVTLPAVPGQNAPAPAQAAKPFYCALGIPTGSAGC